MAGKKLHKKAPGDTGGRFHSLSLAEFLYVVINRCLNDTQRGFRAGRLIDRGLFSFQLLIDGEEMAHLLENMLGKLINVLIHIIHRVVERDRDDLFIVFAIVDHRDHTDRIAANQAQRNQRFRTEHQHIQRVTVVPIGAGNEPVVRRIVGGGVKDAVQNDQSGFLIQFILVLAALANLDHRNKIFFCDPFGRNVMPNIHNKTPFPCINKRPKRMVLV